jgi:hypothetical protein
LRDFEKSGGGLFWSIYAKNSLTKFPIPQTSVANSSQPPLSSLPQPHPTKTKNKKINREGCFKCYITEWVCQNAQVLTKDLYGWGKLREQVETKCELEFWYCETVSKQR